KPDARSDALPGRRDQRHPCRKLHLRRAKLPLRLRRDDRLAIRPRARFLADQRAGGASLRDELRLVSRNSGKFTEIRDRGAQSAPVYLYIKREARRFPPREPAR